MADNYGNKLRRSYSEERATSLDDLVLLRYFRKEPRIWLEDSREQQKVAQDDCSIYMMSRTRAKAFIGMDGWNRSETKSAAHITNANPSCRCLCGRQKPKEPYFDPIASPGPRSLLHCLPSEAVDSPSASFKIPAAVPFGWEEVPGKPKIDPANSKPNRSLQLPPRLLSKSFIGDRAGRHQTKSVSHVLRSSSHGKKEKTFLFYRSADLSIMRSPRSFFSGADPTSPRSVLVDSHLYSGSSSSSSQPSCILDSETLPPTAPVLEIWTDLTSIAGQGSFLAEDEGQSAFSGEHSWLQFESPLKEFAPPEWPDGGNSSDQWAQAAKSIGKIFKLIKGRGFRRQRTSSDVPMWAPTLAAYFQSATKSEQLDLLKYPDGQRKLSHRNTSESAMSAVDEKPSVEEVPPLNCVCHCRSWDRALQAHQLQKSSSASLKSTLINCSKSNAAHEDLNSGISGENTDHSHSWSPACGSWLSSPQLRSMHNGRWQRKVKSRSRLIEIHRNSNFFGLMVKAMKNFFIAPKK
ncbi:hypothetical protein O6H91_15G081100 [Diphasiastrum complanatum]|uniref:Uncharacterized protein n=1 Tax=Diphasiastrum complanatum TaxID=34168 RepID=A0ACC2BK43_DIPCM|nr:hypothetical protein O6H91_15G081100 [Diphasiastrum complanatum]